MPSQCRILSTCWNCYFLNLPSLACERCEKQGHLFKTFFLLKTFCLDHFFSRLDCAVFLFFLFHCLFCLLFFSQFFCVLFPHVSVVFVFLIIFCVFLYFCFSIFVFLCFFHIFFGFPVWLTGVSLFFCFFVFIYVLIPTCCGMGSSCCVYHC